jgi:hypothetical protein
MSFKNVHISIKIILASVVVGIIAVVQNPAFVSLLPVWAQPLWSVFIGAAIGGGGAYAVQSPVNSADAQISKPAQVLPPSAQNPKPLEPKS